MALLIDQLSSSSRLTINGLKSGLISGYLSDNVGLAGKVRYSSPETSAMQNKASSVLHGAASVLNFIGGGDIPQTQAKNVVGTCVKWQGNENFELSIPLLFVATKKGDDVRKFPSAIISSMYPDLDGEPSFTDLLKAPNSFSTTITGKAKGGLCSIRIGKWFKTPKLFLIDGAHFDFSKEHMEDTGFPLYARGVVNFMSYRILTRGEVQSFLS